MRNKMKKIQYLRVLITEKCNLNCFFCHREGINTEKNIHLNHDDLISCVHALYAIGIRKIKFMGGEPTLYPNLSKIIKKIKESYNDVDVSIISNGIARTELYDEYISSGIDRINISLHGIELNTFKHETNGSLKQLNLAIENIKYINKCGKLGKINYVLLKNVNEQEFHQVLDFIHNENIVLDVLNYLGIDDEEIKKYRYSFEEIISIVSNYYSIENSDIHLNKYSLPSKRLKLKGGGEINLKVTSLNETNFLKNCNNCNLKKYCVEGISAIRLTTGGEIKPCLFRNDLNYDLLTEIRRKNTTETIENLNKYLDKL